MNSKRAVVFMATVGLGELAAAQSGVTIYGRTEMVVGKANNGTSAVANVQASDAWRMDGLTSRLGFIGTEDLGGGLKAFFNIEHRFKTDTGAATSASTYWEGRSVMGLSGGFGDVVLGRDYIPAFYPGIKVDPFGYDTSIASVTGQAWAGYSVNLNSRAANMVSYKSPSFAGFTTRVATSMGEGVVRNTNGANLEYAVGPAYAGLAFSHTASDNKVTIASVAYDFGFVRPAAWYSVSRHSGGVPGRSIALAATAPVGSGIAKFVYQVFDPDTDNGNLNVSAAQGGAVRRKVGVGYEYFLSKRTSVFAIGAVGKQAIDTRSTTTAFDLGFRHTF